MSYESSGVIFQAPSHYLTANVNESFDQLNNRPVCIEDPFLVVSPKRGNTALAQLQHISRLLYVHIFYKYSLAQSLRYFYSTESLWCKTGCPKGAIAGTRMRKGNKVSYFTRVYEQ